MSKTKITREHDLLRGWEKLQEIKAMFTLGRWESVVAKVKEQQDENAQLKVDYAEIQAIRDAELSHIYRLREGIKDYLNRIPEHLMDETFSKLHDLYSETAEQSLVHVQAAAIREVAGNVLAGAPLFRDAVLAYADKVEKKE